MIRADKREGDGATPLAPLRLVRVLYVPTASRHRLAQAPVDTLSPSDGWCDDPALPAYNQRVRLPIDGSAEALWRDDNLYDIIGDAGLEPVANRPRPRLRDLPAYRPSPDYAPTEGCVALSPEDLRRVLALGLTEIIVRA